MKIFIHEKTEFIKITGANRPDVQMWLISMHAKEFIINCFYVHVICFTFSCILIPATFYVILSC